MKLLRIENISKSYGEKLACNNINLSINSGELFTLLGPSGCGKTTLLRLIAGFINPEKGEIFLNGENITRLPIEKRGIGMVFQNYALFPHMNVYDNIAYGLNVKKFSKEKVSEKVEFYLKMVNLKGYDKRKISELSGGEQQRVALARALITEPKLLLLDEPFSNLDARLKDHMRIELKELQRKLGITTVFVTHDQKEALNLSDKIAVFKDGEAVQVGTPMDVYLKPVNRFVANFVGENNIFDIGNFPFRKIENSELGNKFFSIRPQDILMSKKLFEDNGSDKFSKRYVCQGTVKNLTIGGELLEYTVKVSENIDIFVTTLNCRGNNGIYNLGDNVYLSIDKDVLNPLEY